MPKKRQSPLSHQNHAPLSTEVTTTNESPRLPGLRHKLKDGHEIKAAKRTPPPAPRPNPMSQGDFMMTPSEVAKYLGISKATFWRYRQLPGFPAGVHYGPSKRSLRIPKSAVIKWIRSLKPIAGGEQKLE